MGAKGTVIIRLSTLSSVVIRTSFDRSQYEAAICGVPFFLATRETARVVKVTLLHHPMLESQRMAATGTLDTTQTALQIASSTRQLRRAKSTPEQRTQRDGVAPRTTVKPSLRVSHYAGTLFCTVVLTGRTGSGA